MNLRWQNNEPCHRKRIQGTTCTLSNSAMMPSTIPKRRPFFMASIVMMVIALCLHATAQSQIHQRITLKAKIIQAATQEGKKVPFNASNPLPYQYWHLYSYAGTSFCSCGLFSWIVSLRRHEPGWHSIPLLLLFFDVMISLLLI